MRRRVHESRVTEASDDRKRIIYEGPGSAAATDQVPRNRSASRIHLRSSESTGEAQAEVPSVVATDGTVTDGPYPESKEHLGGFAVVDVHSREDALEWAAKIAAACRCAQEVFELLPDPAA